MTAHDTAAIRDLKSKRSKCADVGNLDLSNVPESHEIIWLQWGDNGGDDDTWAQNNINDEDIPYVRADLAFSLCDALDEMRAELSTLRARGAEMRAALTEIANITERKKSCFPDAWREQIAACAECQRYKHHPIQQGICDDHRKPIYSQQDHDAHETKILGYRAQSIARAALAQKGTKP